MKQGVRNGVDLVDAPTGERTQQRWHKAILAQHDRDQDLLLLNARIGEIADLGLDPPYSRVNAARIR